MIVVISFLCLVLGLLFGYFARELLSTLKRFENVLRGLNKAQAENQPPETTFAEPLTRAEMAAMLESERIALLNPDKRE